MATSNNNDIGYSTTITGTVKSVLSCLTVVLYNKYQFYGVPGYERISLYNIDTVYKIVSGSEYSLRLNRSTSDDTFTYNPTAKTSMSGFNTMIYVSTSGKPLGYTEFINTQGKGRNIDIEINLKAVVGSNITVTLNNTLEPLRNYSTSVKKSFTGINPNEYTTSEEILGYIGNSKRTSGFSSHLTALSDGDSIYMLDRVVTRDSGEYSLSKLSVSKGISSDIFNNNFTDFCISWYGDDIALYMWKENKYNIVSLTQKNKFGNYITYTKSSSGYLELPDSDSISYGCGRFLKCTSEKIYDTLGGDYITTSGTTFLDTLDPKSKIYQIPENTQWPDIYQYIPSLAGICINLEEYSKSYQIEVIRKIGSWFILKKKLRGGITIYSLVNECGILYLTEAELSNIMVLNDNTVILRESGYRLIYKSTYEREYYTERARNLISGGTLTIDPEFRILISSESENKEYYRNKEIEIVRDSESISTTALLGYRKNSYPLKETKIPNIIGCCDGLIFYLTDDNIINYI